MERGGGGRAAEPEFVLPDRVQEDNAMKEDTDNDGAERVKHEPGELVRGIPTVDGESVEESVQSEVQQEGAEVLYRDHEQRGDLVLGPVRLERTTRVSIKVEVEETGERETADAGESETEQPGRGRGRGGDSGPPRDHGQETYNTSGAAERRTSRAWRFFTSLGDSDHKARCNICGKIRSYKGGGPFNLIRHIKSHHPAVLAAETSLPGTSDAPDQDVAIYVPAAPISASSDDIINHSPTGQTQTASHTPSRPPTTSPSTTSQPTDAHSRLPKITDYLSKLSKNTETINRALVKLFTKNYLPFSLVETPEFREFVHVLDPDYRLPSRKTLSNVLVENYYNTIKEKIKAELAQVENVALSTEAWSAGPSDNYVGVTAHFINREAELRSYTLECAQYSDRDSPEQLARRLREICEDWEIERKVGAVTTDDAADVRLAVRRNGWERLPCFAHSLNLVVQNAIPEIKSVHLKVRRIVDLFMRSPRARERLRATREAAGEPPLKVKRDVATRWGSTCDMFERVMQMKDSLLSTLAACYPEMPALTAHDLKVLEKATELLSFFKDVTEEMSSERNVAISEVIFITNALKSKCTELLGEDGLPPAARALAHALVAGLQALAGAGAGAGAGGRATLEAALLDPRLKRLGFHERAACDRAVALLTASAGAAAASDAPVPSDLDLEPPPAKKRSIWTDFDAKIQEIARNTSPASRVQREIDKYLEEAPLPRTRDPLKWWLAKRDVYPRLYSVACERLAVSATCVPSERIFTKAGQVIMERRNRLTGNKVNRNRISIAIQRGNAASILGTMPQGPVLDLDCLCAPAPHPARPSETDEHASGHTGGKPYACDMCAARFSRNYHLKRHQALHTGVKPHTCGICSKQFALLQTLKKHQRVHEPDTTSARGASDGRIVALEKPYTVEICKSESPPPAERDRAPDITDRRVHAGEKPSETLKYSCEVCAKKFKRPSKLKQHAVVHTRETPYSCGTCGRPFRRAQHLRRHELLHTGDKPHACAACGKTFAAPYALRAHERTHSGEKRHACGECGKRFAELNHLRTHRLIHTGGKPYTCDVCSKRFRHLHSMRVHVLVHTGKKPHACEICKKTFSQKASLKRHERTHTGEKPYACETCNRQFSDLSHLRIHERIHTGETPYSCEVCSMAFRRSHNLNDHMRKHVGNKPYTCGICETEFRQYSIFKKHEQTHNEVPPEVK